MKKLLLIVCLIAGALFVNTADASMGSPVRNGRGAISVGTVRVAAACTTCGVSVRPVVTPVVRRPVVVRPVVSVCTTCGHSFGHRHAFRGHRHFGRRHFGHRSFGHRSFGRRSFGRRLHHRRFACTRCGR